MRTHRKYWQFAFLAGLVTCIVVAFLVLGEPKVTISVTVISLIIAVLNAVLGANTSGPEDQTWLRIILKKMLYVSPFLKAATCLIWLCVVGLTAYWWLVASRIITLEGHVLTAQGSPAVNATVKLYLSSGEVIPENAPSGKFTFSQVDLSREPSMVVNLQAFGPDPSEKRQFDLAKNIPKKIELKLSPGKPPFRLKYYHMDGTAVSYLIRGKLDPEWKKILKGEPAIIHNDVLQALKSLLEKYYFPVSTYGERYLSITESSAASPARPDSVQGDDLADAESNSRPDYNQIFINLEKSPPFFLGAEDNTWFIEIDSFTDFMNLLTPVVDWQSKPYGTRHHRKKPPVSYFESYHDSFKKSFRIKNPIDNLYLGNFQKFATAQDLRKIQRLKSAYNKHLDYLLQVTASDMPPDFCHLVLDLLINRCGEKSSWMLAVYPPKLRVKFAVVENSSFPAQPIQLGNFFFKENNTLSLRTMAEDQLVRQKMGPQANNWFSLGILMPGEKILIPLEIIFGENEELKRTQEKFLYDNRQQIQSDYQTLVLQLGNKNTLNIPFPIMQKTQKNIRPYAEEPFTPSGKAELFQVSSKDLLKIIKSPFETLAPAAEYLYGPSITIESLESDGLKYDFRPEDTRKFVLYSGREAGCCPFVLTYSAQDKKWLDEGHVLYGRNSKSKESTEEKLLSRFDGRILLQEREPELAFIDLVQIKIVSPNGDQRVLAPDNRKLRHQDGDYIKLSQGESLEVKFNHGAVLPGEKIFLVASGFYLPQPNK